MTEHDEMVAGIVAQSAVAEACRTLAAPPPSDENVAAAFRRQMASSTDPDRLGREALRADLAEAKRHIETLTAFYMDNVLWTRAAEEARGFARGLPTYGKGLVEQVADAQADFSGVTG